MHRQLAMTSDTTDTNRQKHTYGTIYKGYHKAVTWAKYWYTYRAAVTITPANPATTPMTTTVVSLELLLCAALCEP